MRESIERGMSAAYFRFLPHGSPSCLSAFSLRANRCHLSINALCLKVSLHEYVQVCVLYELTLPFCGSSCLHELCTHACCVSISIHERRNDENKIGKQRSCTVQLKCKTALIERK